MADGSRYIDINNRPPHFLGPRANRPQILVDDRGVYLIDPAGNFIGLDGNRGRGGKLIRASRAGTRSL